MSGMRRASYPILAVFLLAASPARAYDPPTTGDLFGTRSLSMGNAFRSVASSNEALFLNPAGMGMGRRYEIDGTYGFSPGSRLRLLHASIVDSKTSGVGVGIGYTHLQGNGEVLDSSGSLVHLGFGIPLASRVAMGFTFKYLGFSAPEDTNSITADVGLLVRPVQALSIGLVTYNVIDVASGLAPFRAGGGISLGTDTFLRLAADVVFAMEEDDPLGTTYHAGGEILLDDSIPIRLGFERRAGENRNFVTGGIGLVSEVAGIEAAYAQGVGAGRFDERILSFTLKLFL